MSELAFLLDLLLNHDELPKDVRTIIKDRIVLVEANSTQPYKPVQRPTSPYIEPTVPGVAVASQAASEALASRGQAIAIANSGTPEKGRTSPRKF
jgi:hypothetical protein